ncbi:MAG: aspartate dehydrogenase [Pseudomonadota bacterium]
MKIGIIGDGAIGRYVAQHLSAEAHVIITRAERLDAREPPAVHRVARAEDVPEDTDLMIDCAGHQALEQYGVPLLERGLPLITVSVGALADASLHARLAEAARAGGTKLHLASGAIGALDCLQAAKVGGLERVRYVGRKPPKGWRGSPAEDTLNLDTLDTAATHFEGTARDAARLYPKNANVAAAVALAGIGFDATQVRLIADPLVSANIHEIEASGAFGAFRFRIEGKALPDNPKSSALAAMSAVAAIQRHQDPIGF